MNIFVDTSVWSLALRRDAPPDQPQVAFLRRALETGESVFTTGLVLQELLQGFRRPKMLDAILTRFALLPFLVAQREDHVRAAELHIACRRRGIQVGTIDALLAQLCLRDGLIMLSTDLDFRRIARVRPLAIWEP